MSTMFGFDAYSPKEISERIETLGVSKGRLPLLSILVLGVLAFSLGLILLIVAGTELFTGNNLLAMVWAECKISSAELLNNWGRVCGANFIGAAGLAILVFLSGHLDSNQGAVSAQ
jgi:formate transporter